MNTIFYSAEGIAALFVFAFLFAFYEDISNTWKYKLRKARRLIRQMDRSEESERNTSMRISSCNGELLSEKEETNCDVSTNTVAM